jgi:phosphoribosylformylglycinamidine (FGAM) synthase PurS component
VKARVFVTLKPSVFDPQGQVIAEALHSLGYDADRLLANPVIESFRVEVA